VIGAQTGDDSGRRPRRAVPSDRCPYSRPFPVDFSDCPTYQAVTFIAADSLNRPLGSWLTCRHLTSGSSRQERGQFYPRCGLGGPAERLRWRAQVGPAQLDVVRVLQEEFDRFSSRSREELIEAKAEVLRSPAAPGPREHLEELLRAFLGATRAFLAKRRERFEEAGLPTEPLMQLIEDWAWEWVKTRDLVGLGFSEERLQAFATPSRRFLGALIEPARGRNAPAEAGKRLGSGMPGGPAVASAAAGRETSPRQPVFESAMLQVTRTLEPPGLSLVGEIDASNLDAVTDSLAGALAGTRDLHVDLSGVSFCDLAGMRAILRTAQMLGAGQRLVLQDVPRILERAMEIIGWAEMPNLMIVRSAAS
jgi:anti-anti-sigma factor